MPVMIQNSDDSLSSPYISYGWLKKSSVKILGTKYYIIVKDVRTDKEFEKNAGYEDYLLHQIVLADLNTCKDAGERYAYINELSDIAKIEFEKSILRHEIVHCFLDESGLRQNTSVYYEGWSLNEEMVDWISIQLSKIYKVYKKIGLV